MTATNTISQRILEAIRDVAVLPNFEDKEATRDWLDKVLTAIESIPQWWIVLPNLGDMAKAFASDDMLSPLGYAVRDNDELFDSLHRLLRVMVTPSSAQSAIEAAAAVRQLAERAKAAGIDPVSILTVVECMISLARLICEK